MHRQAKPSVAVVGDGAIGLSIAAALYQAGTQAILIARNSESAEHLTNRGVTICQNGESAKPVFPRVSPRPADASSADLVLICVKAYDTAAAMEALAPHLAQGTPVILVQNGVGSHVEASKHYPMKNLFAGIITYGAFKDTQKRIHQYGHIAMTIAPVSGADSPAPECIGSPQGIDIVFKENAAPTIWSKLCVNCAINPVTALHGLTNGELTENAEAWALALSAMREACQVAEAAGVQLTFTDPADELRRVCSITSDNRSSMLQDITLGRQTEIEYINGYVITLAKQHGIRVPINQQLYDAINCKRDQ